MTPRIRLSAIGALLSLIAAPTSASTVVVRAGWVVDPVEGRAVPDQLIVIENSQIRAVGDDPELPPEAAIIDLSDAYVLPGLFDVHTHLCADIQLAGEDVSQIFQSALAYTVLEPTPYRALQGAANARTMLDAGFTTVRDVGNAGSYADVALKRAIGEGLVIGPRMEVSGKIIAPFGAQFSFGPEHPDLGEQDYIYADTRDEILRAIRRNLHFGADWIKIAVDEQRYGYSRADLEFIVAEATAAGCRVAAHCGGDDAARIAIEAGVASIEHGTRMSAETLRLARSRGVVLVGTDHSAEVLRKGGIPEDFVQWRSGVLTERLALAHDIDVPMAFGSDIFWRVDGHSRGTAALLLLDTWMDAGVPSPDILRAMTVNAARLLHMENDRGRIASEMKADLIAVREDPLADIRALRHIVFVMKAGVVHIGAVGAPTSY